MNRIVAGMLAATVLFPAAAGAQIKTLPGESLTVTATVDAIEHASRSLTLRKPDNTVSTIMVPKDYLRFDALKVGDKVSATYYDNIVIRKKAAGEKTSTPRAPRCWRLARGPSRLHGRRAARHYRDDHGDRPEDPVDQPVGPGQLEYSSRVEDRDALKQVKVGDRLDITWTEALMLSTTAPK